MANFIEEERQAAEAAITAMKAAALHARALHARAELLRHMQTTARKVAHLPHEEAVERVVGEWMKAWHLKVDGDPAVAAEMRAFTAAACAFSGGGGPEADLALRRATAALEAALGRIGTSIADQMAWRSECAHGWWEAVSPTPADLPGRRERPGMPLPERGRPFWDAACAPHCRPDAT